MYKQPYKGKHIFNISLSFLPVSFVNFSKTIAFKIAPPIGLRIIQAY